MPVRPSFDPVSDVLEADTQTGVCGVCCSNNSACAYSTCLSYDYSRALSFNRRQPISVPCSWLGGASSKRQDPQLDDDEELALKLAMEFQDEKKALRAGKEQGQYEGTEQMRYK